MNRSFLLSFIVAVVLCAPQHARAADDTSAPSASPSTPPPPTDPSAEKLGPSMAARAPPYFPDDEKCRRIGGEVSLVLSYDQRGSVTDIAVMRTSGNRDLDRAAINSAWGWRVNPVLRNGVRMAGEVVVPVEFVAPTSKDPICDSAVRIQAIQFEREVFGAGALHGIRPNIARTDVALLRTTYFVRKRKTDSRISVDWYLVDGPSEPILHATSLPLISGRNTVDFRFSPKDGMKPGKYSVEISVDGQRRQSLRFSVADNRTGEESAEQR